MQKQWNSFRVLVWSQNLKSLKFNHHQTPDMNNSVSLDRIYSASDTICHNIDIRNPDQSLGWYNIKNIGFYFSRQQIFRVKDGAVLKVGGEVVGINPDFYLI